MKKKIIYIVFFGLFRHLWNYNENKNHIYLVFRIILDTYGIIMKMQIIYIVIFGLFRHLWNYNKNKKSYILCFSDYCRHLWNYNENKNHINCVFRTTLDTYGIIMKIKIIYIMFFGLF